MEVSSNVVQPDVAFRGTSHATEQRIAKNSNIYEVWHFPAVGLGGELSPTTTTSTVSTGSCIEIAEGSTTKAPSSRLKANEGKY